MNKTSRPLVSIIIPFYNNSSTLAEALNSALAQTYSNLEVILVNDFSTDRSEIVVRELLGQDERLVLYNAEKKGVSAARNFGLQQSNGDYVVFLDADDKLKENYIEKAIDCFFRNDKLTIVYSNMELFERETGILNLPNFELQSFLEQNCIPIFAMVRAKNLKEIGGFDESLHLCEDWECWMRLLKIYGGEVYRIEEPLYFYRKRMAMDSVLDTQNTGEDHYENVSLYIFTKHQDLYRHNKMSLDFLLKSTKEFSTFKRKYYMKWYRKLVYKLFMPQKYKCLYEGEHYR